MNQRTYIVKISMLYLILTYFYFLFGRYNWNAPSYFKLTFFVLVSYFSFYFGFIVNLKKYRLKYLNYFKSKIYIQNLRVLHKVFKLSCILLIVFQISWMLVVFGKISFFEVFQNLGSNYYQRLSTNFESNVLIMQIRTMFWGLTLFAYPIGFYFYKELTISEKALFIFTIFIDVLTSLNMGISKNIGDIILIYVACSLIKVVNVPPKNIVNYKLNNYRRVILTIFIFLISFYLIQVLRDANTNISYLKRINPYYQFSTLRNITIFDYFFLSYAPITNIIDKIGAYVSHGYMGLAYALEIPFKNTFGVGFSRALLEYFNQYFAVNVIQNTYNERIELMFGWNNGIYWPTALVWFGNIISIWFVPAILYIYGKLLSKVINRFSINGDIFSLALLCQLFIGVIYFPANNQLFQSRMSFFGTVFLLLAFYLSERKLYVK